MQRSVWVHAVSVGEVKAVEKLVEGLGERFAGRAIVVSTVTPTGQQLAMEQRHIVHATFYFPFDLPGCVRRTLDRVRPEMVIMAETEIWPNFLRACRERGIPVIMINGRISDRSFRRYRLVRRWLRKVLADYRLLGMQSETDRRRMEALGADPEKVGVLGNLKFDAAAVSRPLEPKLAAFFRDWHSLGEGKGEFIWVAASTMPGEEAPVLDAFGELRRQYRGLKLVIAPRHPERFDEVQETIRRKGFPCTRRTRLPALGASPAEVLLLDTIGELAGIFEFASVVFMGGTLVARGGHNILEPARHRKPVIFGPHMENFRDIARLFLQAEAAIQIERTADLGYAVGRVLSSAELAAELGASARRIIDENTGATDRVLNALTPMEAQR